MTVPAATWSGLPLLLRAKVYSNKSNPYQSHLRQRPQLLRRAPSAPTEVTEVTKLPNVGGNGPASILLLHPLDRGNPTYTIDSMQLTEPGKTSYLIAHANGSDSGGNPYGLLTPAEGIAIVTDSLKGRGFF